MKYEIVYNYCTSLNIFNNISVISWRSVILVEEVGENHRLVASNWQTSSHIVVDPTTIPSRPRRPLLWMCIKYLNIIQVYNLKHTYHHFRKLYMHRCNLYPELSLHSLQSLSTPICQESWQNPFNDPIYCKICKEYHITNIWEASLFIFKRR